MPLSSSVLSTELQTEIAAVLNIVDPAQLKKVCDAIAAAVVTHIQNNALVSGTVTSGAGAGGTVTGTVS